MPFEWVKIISIKSFPGRGGSRGRRRGRRALTIAWDAFEDAAGDDLVGWEITAAAAEVQPGPGLTGAEVRPARIGLAGWRAEPEREGHQVVIHFMWRAGASRACSPSSRSQILLLQ
jgi:hypothetical protein